MGENARGGRCEGRASCVPQVDEKVWGHHFVRIDGRLPRIHAAVQPVPRLRSHPRAGGLPQPSAKSALPNKICDRYGMMASAARCDASQRRSRSVCRSICLFCLSVLSRSMRHARLFFERRNEGRLRRQHVSSTSRTSVGRQIPTARFRQPSAVNHRVTPRGICRPSTPPTNRIFEPARWNPPSISGRPNAASLTRQLGTALMDIRCRHGTTGRAAGGSRRQPARRMAGRGCFRRSPVSPVSSPQPLFRIWISSLRERVAHASRFTLHTHS